MIHADVNPMNREVKPTPNKSVIVFQVYNPSLVETKWLHVFKSNVNRTSSGCL